ncbi:XRE family transcriptional regulator [Rhodophyticola sp. CCM32]|uniref:helix-turn-helix transcriptional regulator n=1 Tax=Rhodophyticola sp. CCM32 TaxID=2916397 RepID=UPI00107F9060|nr:helix-turn-helix transcriptional regulator [Rhodophyticola sp. CCM32]QBY00900.1 XRE family transcriptional regulator [Rhodophyticola sp. CCM32]
MTPRASAQRRHALTGSRIRERRTAMGFKQTELARAVGISASYLNLIEHNRRRIGGKLLVDLARRLEVEPAALSEGADATLFDALQGAAADSRSHFGTRPEISRIDELAGRFPGWTGLIAAQHKRIAGLEVLVDGLHDRLSHDPVLAETMHEVLSTVAAIRSTADILVRDPEIEPQWRARFHRNLHEEAERLSGRATGMLAYFEDQGRRQDAPATPQETVEALFDAADHHFPGIEERGGDAIEDVLADLDAMQDPATHALADHSLRAYAEDAARLPLTRFLQAARDADFKPEPLLPLAGGDVALVLRRLATLPGGTGAPPLGLAICDMAGALIFRRRINAFSIPRFGAGCPLWPLYHVLSRPMVPETTVLDLPNGARFQAWAVCQPMKPAGFGVEPVMHATMLLRPLDEGDDRAAAGHPVGPGCAVCPRDGCAARRMDSLIG